MNELMNGEGERPEKRSENWELVLFTSVIQGVVNFSTESMNFMLAKQGSSEYFRGYWRICELNT